MSAQEIILPPAASAGISRTRVAAFVPLALALVGVAAIMLGGVSSRGTTNVAASAPGVDPVVTGSIVSADEQQRAMKMLDR
ncbi:MAG TPA: hypothetical protein VG894_05470 [Bauldia sp.]|nr:hypothetical protein [Bauldia sp.]